MANASLSTRVAKEAAATMNSSINNLTKHAANLNTHVQELQNYWHGGTRAKNWYNNISKHYDSIIKKIEEVKPIQEEYKLIGEGWTKP